jgi:NTE family protein
MVQTKPQYCDLVLEGGGVKAIGLVGALTVLSEHGYVARRVAGTSTGAIVGALLASGMKPSDMHLGIAGLDYKRLRDTHWLWGLGPVGKVLSLVTRKGVYDGRYLQKVVESGLRDMGVTTFADLRITEPWANVLPPEQRYKLVVLAADVSRGRLARLPWDYHRLGLNPDKQRVSEAVRASMSIPFYYKPVKLNKHLLVDGSILSKFPIDLFDQSPDWPTFGIKLWSKPGAGERTARTGNTLEYAQAVLSTMLNGRDQLRFDDAPTVTRTIYVDTEDVGTTDFDINLKRLERIYVNGRLAAQEFLKTWDFAVYKAQFSDRVQ